MGLRADHAALMERYLAQFRGGPSPRAFYDDDYVEVYPQSGEQVVGPSEAIEAIRRQPAGVTIAGDPHLTSCGEDRVLLEVLLDYAGPRSWLVALFETHAGRLHRTTAYFGDPFEAPAWRAAWAERLDPLDPAAWDGDGDGQPVEEADVDRVVRGAIGGDVEAVRAAAHPDYRGSFPQSGGAVRPRRPRGGRRALPGRAARDEAQLGGRRDRALDRQPGQRPGPGDRRRRQLGRRGAHALPVGRALLRADRPGLPRTTGLAPALLLLRPVRGGPVPGSTWSTGSTPARSSADPAAGAAHV